MNNKQLDSYSILICSKYFIYARDFINIVCVCKKFKETTKKLRFNPIPIKSLKLFPKIQTQYLYSEDDTKIEGIDNYEICYNVNYDQYLKFKQDNIKCHHVIYTRENRVTYGNEIPCGVNMLFHNCFSGCWRSLTSINLPTTITSLGNDCFSCCHSLTSITIPFTLNKLSSRCFNDCSALKAINLPSSIVSIGDECFNNCYNLESINLPTTITSLGERCFNCCMLLLDNLSVPSHCL